MLQCSGLFDIARESGMLREDFIGTHAREWNAAGIVAEAMFSHPSEVVSDYIVSHATEGLYHVATVGMRIHQKAKAIVVGWEPHLHHLTDAETTVMRHLADGLSQGEVATAAGRSVESVKALIASVKRKFSARTTVQAVAKCCWSGII